MNGIVCGSRIGSSFLVPRSSFSCRSPLVVMGLAVERGGGRLGVNIEHIVAASRLLVGIVAGAELDPLLLAGHRINEIAVAKEADLLVVHQLDRFGQVLQVLWIVGLADGGLVLDASGDAEVVVVVDGVGDLAQMLA